MKPFVDVCKEEKKGLFILVKTSNPSSGEFQDRLIDGRPLYELVGEQVAKWGEDCMGDDYSYVGAVVGATYPEQGKVLRKIMPKSLSWYQVMVHRAEKVQTCTLLQRRRTWCDRKLIQRNHCCLQTGAVCKIR